MRSEGIKQGNINIIKAIILSVVFFILLFENAIQMYIPTIGNFNEIIFILVVLLAGYKIITSKNRRKDSKGPLLDGNSYKILISVGIMYLIGITGNLVYKYQYLNYALKDLLTFRAIIAYAILPLVIFDFNIDKYKKVINRVVQISVSVLFVLLIVNTFFNVIPYYEIRFGIKAQQLLFSHPTYLVSAGIFIIAILSAFIKDYKENKYFIFITYIVILSTLRTKAIVFLISYLYFLYIVMYKKRKLNNKDIILLVIIAVLVMGGKTVEYLQNPDWARSALSINSVNVAIDHFPIGSGFGTYGSWRSAINYSPLYYQYGMETLWGTAPDSFSFIADSFWPMILGQIGVIGVVLMIYIIFIMYKDINKNTNLYYYFGQITILGYLIVASIAEPTFTAPHAILALGIIRVLNKE